MPIDDDRPYDLVRDAVAELDLPLVRIEQRRRGLEDLFPTTTPGAEPVGDGGGGTGVGRRRR